MSDIRFEIIKKIANIQFKYKSLDNLSELESTSPPSVFVGSQIKEGIVNIGILSPLEKDNEAWIYDSPKYWASQGLGLKEVLHIRKGLLNSIFRAKIIDPRKENKFLKMSQELALSSKPVDVEIKIKSKINTDMKKDRILTPQGMTAQLENARITSNIKVDPAVEKAINDDVKASESIAELHQKNYSEYFLSQILSIGSLGLKKDKKLVPTRWAITATDDIIGKKLIEKIKNYKELENHELFFGEYMGNAYLIFLFPRIFSFELFELYLPGSSWNPTNEIKAATDYESHEGRKNYAENTGGGYYATRLPVTEYLEKIKRKASVLVIRIELPSYWAALGVWVVRESVRKALETKKLSFNEMRDMFENARKISMIKFGFDPEKVFKKSKIIENIKTQTTLGKWV
jgi:hypothetical protein